MSVFFITGEQRSGTTLLAVMLGKHAEVMVGEDAIGFRITSCLGLLEKVLPYNPQHPVGDILSWLIKVDYKGRLADFLDFENMEQYPDARTLIAQSIDKTLRQHGKKIWGDKVPNMHYHMGDLLKLVPEARIIHMIRDGRAVAASKLKRTHRHPEVTGQDWVEGNAKGVAMQQLIGKEQYKIVKYEDLLTRPEATLSDICGFLSIDYQDSMVSLEQAEGVEAYVKSSLDVSKIDAYKNELSPSLLRKVERLQKPLLEYFEYDLLYEWPIGKYHPLSVRRRIWLNFIDNFKALFRGKRKGMRARKNVDVHIPFHQRVKKLIYSLASEILSQRIFARLTRRRLINNVYMDEDLNETD